MSTPVYNSSTGLPVKAPDSWLARNWKWFFPAVVVSAVLAIALFIGGIFLFVTSLIRSSEPYQTAIQKADRSVLVAMFIGRPFRAGRIVQGNLNVNSDSGEANLSIPITGPRGKGHVIVSAKKQNGKWTYQTLEVHVDGSETVIPLLTPAPGQPGSAGVTDDSA